MKRMALTAGILGFLGIAVMAAEPPAASDLPSQIEFKFKFEPGRTCGQRIVSKSVGSLIVPAPGPLGEMKFSQVFEETMTSTCRKVNPDQSAVMDMVISDLAMRMSIGGFKIDYDAQTFDPKTADPMTSMIGRVFGAMNGASFTVTVSGSGHPLKVEGLAESMKKIMATISEGNDAAEVKQLLDQFANLMSDDSMNEQMQSFYRMSPTKEGPLKIGDKWSQTWAMKMPLVGGDFEGRGDYELLGIEEFKGRKCAKIRLKESFKMQPRPKDAPAKEGASAMEKVLAGMQMELSTSGGDGIAYIDYERGELVQLRQTQNLSLVMKIPMPASEKGEDGQAPEMPPFTMKIRNSVSIDPVDNPSAQGAKPAAKAARKAAPAEKQAQPKADK